MGGRVEVVARRAMTWLRGGPTRASFEVLGLGLGLVVAKDLISFPVFYGSLAEPNRYVFPYLGVPRIPWTAQGAVVAWSVQGVAWLGAVLLLTGAWARVGSLLLLGCYGHAFVADRLGYTNNGYLLLVLLAVHALGDGLDEAESRVVGRAAQVFIASIYLTAALTKLTSFWLSGTVLREALFFYQPVYGRWFGWDSPWLFRVGAAATVAGELTMALGLWNYRTRRFAIPLGVALHVGIELLLPVRFFSYLMVTSYVLFVSPPTARWLRDRLRRLPAALWPLVAVAAGAALDRAFDWWAGNYGVRLDTTLPVLGALPVGWVILAATRWRARPRQGPGRGFGLRAGWALVPLGLLHGYLLLKPAWGAPTDFSFRLFSTLTQVRVNAFVRVGGQWRPNELYGASHRWSTRFLLYTWDAWPDQRERLEHYVAWLARHEDVGDRVRLVADLSLDHGPARRAVFEAAVPGYPDLPDRADDPPDAPVPR